MGLAPSRLQDFRLDAKIGIGSTARVFDAEHIPSGRRVAIKMLEPGAGTSPEHRERLAREALLLSQVNSPHVANILGFGYDHDKPFLVLERLDGETFDDYMKREKTADFEVLVPWIEELLIGLRDIHALGIVHRDVKPSNVFLSKGTNGASGEVVVKLIDFGVARLKDTSAVKDPLTSTNHVIGSLGYMAPEQFKSAREVTPAADLYAVGVVIYRAISGRLPFVHRSLEKVLKMKTEQDPPRLSAVQGMRIHHQLDDLVFKALAREPERRFQTAREMLEAWWRATAAAGVEAPPPPAPATIEGIDIVFDDPPPSSALLHTMQQTIVGTPELPSERGGPRSSERQTPWSEADPNAITRPR